MHGVRDNVLMPLAVLALAGIAFVGFAGADEVGGMPAPQKPIAQPLLDGLVASWTTESTGTHEGKEFQGTGTSTFARGIGDTAILQTYDGTMPGPDGKPMKFHGHGVYKLSEDGKTVTLWWFCNMNPDVLRVSGPVSDSDLKLSGNGPTGQAVEIVLKKSADGLAFEMKEGTNVMRETYKRN